jgi:hypothetical protein
MLWLDNKHFEQVAYFEKRDRTDTIEPRNLCREARQNYVNSKSSVLLEIHAARV